MVRCWDRPPGHPAAMKNLLRALSFLVMLVPGIAWCQCNSSTPLAANTVLGRLGIGPGPCQAIPFATLSSRLTGAAITLNSGNGQTVPGSISGGNTYTFGATTDTPRFAGIGLGGAAPATGLEVYNAAVAPTGNGQGMVGASSFNGGMLIGQGSVYDTVLANKSSAIALGVTTNTQNVVLQGTLTAASLSTAGTIAGSLCMTSGGLVLYEAAINCFAVSGITVVSGKTLTVDNTIELAGTDGTKFTFPGASDTVGTLAATQTVSGNKTFSGTLNITGTGQINGTAFGTFATQSFATPPAIGGTTPNIGAFSTLTSTAPIGISSGGTNAGTAAGARAASGLNVDSFTPKGDTNYTILATDRTVGTSTSLTAPRTWTLPAASAVNPGQRILIADYAGGVTNTNTLTVTRAGSDTVNGATSVTINVTNGAYELIPDGISKWTAQALGAAATVGVASINGQTGNPSIVAGASISVSTSGGNITVANTSSLNGQTGALTSYFPPQGRLTLTSGTAVMAASVAAAATVYYTPAAGPFVPIYDGTNFIPTAFAEVSQATTDATKSPAAVATSSVYDIFCWVDSAINRCTRGPAWTNDTTRSAGTALIRVNGIYLNNASITNGPAASRGTYVGTIRSNASSTIDYIFGASSSPATAAFFGVWNAYNRVEVSSGLVQDSTSSWTYSTAAFRSSDNSNTTRVTAVFGLNEDAVSAFFSNFLTNPAGAAGAVGIALDATNTNNGTAANTTVNISTTSFSNYGGLLGLGVHFLQATENISGAGTVTFFGCNGNCAGFGNGLVVKLRM